jgi:phosphoribosyl-AMP cyclohydrolase
LSDSVRETGTALDPKWDDRGLIQTVTTDAATGEVLMVAHMNADALAATLATGEAHYWSRSRGEVWHKGATSGNTQAVVELRIDCDQDAVWLRVTPAGPACHTGARSCFYRAVGAGGALVVDANVK